MRLHDRLARLEAAHESGAGPVIVWRGIHESAEAAVTRHLAEHPEHEGRPPLVVGWVHAKDGRPAECCQ